MALIFLIVNEWTSLTADFAKEAASSYLEECTRAASCIEPLSHWSSIAGGET